MTPNDALWSSRLAPLLARASAQAHDTGRPVLVSVAERVDPIDPLSALEAASRISDASLAPSTASRMYWTRPTDDFALAGLGSAISFAPEGADRFARIDRAWSELSNDAIVADPSGGAPGVGPLLMGGFAFDPAGQRTDRWREFPSARLILPRLALAAAGGECWLTTMVLVGADGRPDIASAPLARLREALLRGGIADEPDEEAAEGAPLTYTDARPAADWRALVGAAVAEIRSGGGALEKVVLAREVRGRASRPIDVGATLRALRAGHPGCYVFGCWHRGSAFIGASPERLVRLEGREVLASSLAGSARRDRRPVEDAALGAALLASAKDRQEHEVVRRALCGALEELCDEVGADSSPSLLSLPHVHHLHTAVRARLRAGHSLLELLERLHPTPAVGGAPREAALQFIRARERLDRGWYAAPIGWLQRDRGEFAVALRSALVTGAEASLFAGSGVVADSDPDAEYAESQLKLRPMKLALAAAAGRAAACEQAGR